MKKLFALLAVALGVVACQKDQADFGVNLGGEQEVTINVALSAETRASSALGSLENGVLASHDLRYILEIYQGTHCLRMEKFTTEDNVAFPVRLAPGREYKFAVWADFVKKEGARNADDADEYYETSDGLDSIGIIKGTPMDEARDAFYGKATLAATANLASLSTIELTRPFAKVRVVATDIEDVRKFGIEPDGATVTYTAQLPTRFDAVNGVASTAQTFPAIDYAIVNNAYSDAAGQLTVFADYIFVPESGTISFNLDVKDGGVRIKENNFSTAIPVAVNKVTSIVGDVLTDSKNLDININDKFDAETIYLEGDVTLTEDLNVNRPLVVAAGKTAVLNLNNKKIINTNPSENFGEGEGIVVYGNLTIEGNGTIQGTSMAVWARGNNSAVVTIKGGKFVGCQEGLAKGGRSVVYASSGNVVNIYGGEFKAEAADETSFAATQYPVLNVADNNGTINVYGGRFYKQNPAAPGTEPAAWNTAHPNGFLAEGCVVEADDDWFNVIYDPYYGYTKVASADELVAAINNATTNTNIVFLNDIVGDVTIDNDAVKITIHGDGKTYTGAMTPKSNVTFKNVNFDGKGYNGYAITTRGANYLTIEDCTAKNYGYGFVQLASATDLTTVKNVTVSDMNYGIKVDYSNAVVIENANINVGVAAVLNSNYGGKTITIKNSNLSILGTWVRNNTIKTNYLFEGNNSINTFIIEAALENFKLAAGATLTAPNEITVTTVDGYSVEYTDGKYISK